MFHRNGLWEPIFESPCIWACSCVLLVEQCVPHKGINVSNVALLQHDSQGLSLSQSSAKQENIFPSFFYYRRLRFYSHVSFCEPCFIEEIGHDSAWVIHGYCLSTLWTGFAQLSNYIILNIKQWQIKHVKIQIYLYFHIFNLDLWVSSLTIKAFLFIYFVISCFYGLMIDSS